jgi:hypothetical protein
MCPNFYFDSMVVFYGSIYFHRLLMCPNLILSRKLWPSEVNWVSKFTLHYLACNFLILALFDEWFTPLEISLNSSVEIGAFAQFHLISPWLHCNFQNFSHFIPINANSTTAKSISHVHHWLIFLGMNLIQIYSQIGEILQFPPLLDCKFEIQPSPGPNLFILQLKFGNFQSLDNSPQNAHEISTISLQ